MQRRIQNSVCQTLHLSVWQGSEYAPVVAVLISNVNVTLFMNQFDIIIILSSIKLQVTKNLKYYTDEYIDIQLHQLSLYKFRKIDLIFQE